MNIREILSIGIRIFAILLFLETISTTLSFLSMRDIARENTELLVVSGIYFVIACVAWKFPLTIAKKLTPSDVGEGATSISAFDLSRVGIALLSLNLIINSLWSVIPAIVMLKGGYDADPSMSYSGVFMLLFGFILLMNNRKIASLVLK
ncbi:GNAT family acetyltransferase [Enterovibrio sp. Hal110]